MNYFLFAAVILMAVELGVIALSIRRQNKSKLNKGKESTEPEEPEEPEENNPLIKLSEITEIVLRKESGQELPFIRLCDLSEQKYQEITSAAPYIGTLPEIAQSAPAGLFTTFVSPAVLSAFSDDAITVMIRDTENKWTEAAEIPMLENIETRKLLAAADTGMRAVAAAFGQNHLYQIYGQLEEINSELEKLLDFHHAEKTGLLMSLKSRLSELLRKKECDISDINEIRNLYHKIDEIFQEYRLRLDRESKNISRFEPKEWHVEKRVESYAKEINSMNFILKVCFQADRLCMQTKLAEISVRMKVDYADPALSELITQLQENYRKSFSSLIDVIMRALFESVNSNARKIVGNGRDFLIFDKDADKLLEHIYNKEAKLKKQLKNQDYSGTVNRILLERNERQEVLITLDEGFQAERIFIKAKEE